MLAKNSYNSGLFEKSRKVNLFTCVRIYRPSFRENKLSREPQKKKTQTRANCSAPPTQQALCLRLASMYKAESWQRAVTLDNSTPQCRISEIRVWSYNLTVLEFPRTPPLVPSAQLSSGWTCPSAPAAQNLLAAGSFTIAICRVRSAGCLA